MDRKPPRSESPEAPRTLQTAAAGGRGGGRTRAPKQRKKGGQEPPDPLRPERIGSREPADPLRPERIGREPEPGAAVDEPDSVWKVADDGTLSATWELPGAAVGLVGAAALQIACLAPFRLTIEAAPPHLRIELVPTLGEEHAELVTSFTSTLAHMAAVATRRAIPHPGDEPPPDR